MTGKQRVLEILQQLASDQCDKVNIDKLAITEALDSIEEVLKDVLGEREVFVDIPIVDATGKTTKVIKGESFMPYMIARNNLRAEQLGRWESK